MTFFRNLFKRRPLPPAKPEPVIRFVFEYRLDDNRDVLRCHCYFPPGGSDENKSIVSASLAQILLILKKGMALPLAQQGVVQAGERLKEPDTAREALCLTNALLAQETGGDAIPDSGPVIPATETFPNPRKMQSD